MTICVKSLCSKRTLRKRLPILQWLPKYNTTKLLLDVIAGVTVALTAIPQGIAYAVVTGLSPEYGLYAGIMGGFVYLFFGSSKDVTVGPTAVLSAMTSKYVLNYSADFAVLAAFLAGIVELLMGILQLGFLVEFISGPVISAFITSAALQITSSQLKNLFGLDGSAGYYFAESMYYFIKNIKTANLWDPILGISTIVVLLALKRLGKGCSRTGHCSQKIIWFISLARNAIVIIIGTVIAYIFKVVADSEPFILIGDIGHGLPGFSLPPFNTVVGNETYTFVDMLNVYGPQSIILPLVAILELVAIAKAFSGGQLDATQEMIALGLCNIASSFVRSMPVTGSFTRTVLNNASGVQTPAGGIVTGFIIILALSLLTSTFYYIPKASLSGLIITAMFAMIETDKFNHLWRNSKREFFIMIFTILICLGVGLEYGLIAGTLVEAAILLYGTARPKVQITAIKTESQEVILIPLSEKISYCAAEYIRRIIMKAARKGPSEGVIILDGTELRTMDSTVAFNFMGAVQDLEKDSKSIIFLNFNAALRKMCIHISPKSENKFLSAVNLDECLANSGIIISKIRIDDNIS